MASKKKPQETEKSPEQPHWTQLLEGFFSAIAGAFTGTVSARANELAHDAEKRLSKLALIGVLGATGFVYVTISLVHILRAHFGLAMQWSYLIIGLVLIIAALAYSKR